ALWGHPEALCFRDDCSDRGFHGFLRIPLFGGYGLAMPTLFHTSHPGLAAALRRDPLWAQVSASLMGAHKARSCASIQRAAERKGQIGIGSMSGYGGHFRAVQGFRYVE
ncbi:hypothetical protein V6590_20540, partial [Gemmobacter sp. JM10B15]